VTDGHVAREAREAILGENLRGKPHPLVFVDPAAVSRGDAGALPVRGAGGRRGRRSRAWPPARWPYTADDTAASVGPPFGGVVASL